eukprot:TRINITY_DN3260_c0_g1_i1.p1 TRINITY_DN3260_c0_g1~~TRINITY_DN3260_c0_g1_i1.p1  ORF type:complete len:241 (-),score=43.63 TRINITY_DN3260_c0_g1_i1:97-819(-)
MDTREEESEYNQINQLLKNLRSLRLSRSEGNQRTFNCGGRVITLTEKPEIDFVACVRDEEYWMCKYLEKRFKRKEIENKSTVQIGSGCGLLSIAMSEFGASPIIVTGKESVVLLLEKNISNNDTFHNIQTKEFDWGQPASQLGQKMFSFVLAGCYFLSGDQNLEIIVETLVKLSGNGTTLILGIKRTLGGEKSQREILFRKMLGEFFDFATSREYIYTVNDGKVVVLQLKRKPYSTFLQF